MKSSTRQELPIWVVRCDADGQIHAAFPRCPACYRPLLRDYSGSAYPHRDYLCGPCRYRVRVAEANALVGLDALH